MKIVACVPPGGASPVLAGSIKQMEMEALRAIAVGVVTAVLLSIVAALINKVPDRRRETAKWSGFWVMILVLSVIVGLLSTHEEVLQLVRPRTTTTVMRQDPGPGPATTATTTTRPPTPTTTPEPDYDWVGFPHDRDGSELAVHVDRGGWVTQPFVARHRRLDTVEFDARCACTVDVHLYLDRAVQASPCMVQVTAAAGGLTVANFSGAEDCPDLVPGRYYYLQIFTYAQKGMDAGLVDAADNRAEDHAFCSCGPAMPAAAALRSRIWTAG